MVVVAGGSCSPAAKQAEGGPLTRIVQERQIDPPAAAGALAPNLAVVGGEIAATWLESLDDGQESGHRLMFSRLRGAAWLPPVTIVEGNDFFANWADLPAVVETGGGDLLAHWLAKTGEDVYAYSIFLARSRDGGTTWDQLGRLNRDETDTEHGFVAWVPERDGARAYWLDGREMVAGDPMTLRTAFVGSTIGPDEVIDERTCECCAVDAASTTDGSLVVYRDRDDEETRDIAIVRGVRGGWSAPELVAADGWTIQGCPVNGPAVASQGHRVAVAWFTGAGGASRVQMALSGDGGRTFGPVLELDGGTPLGRVDVVLPESGEATVVWMRQSENEAEILLQQFTDDGASGEETLVARTSAARASGFPRLIEADGVFYLSWVDVRPGEPQRIRAASFVKRDGA